MVTLGYVGLGKMGGRVAKRLLDAGYSVIGYNRTKSKAQELLDAGMQWGETPRQVAEAADITFSMVTNTTAFHEIFDGQHGILAGLEPGKIYVDMSTIGIEASKEAAKRVAAQGAHMLDTPVSGNLTTLSQGNASLMVGGDEAVFEQIKPILQAIGSKVDYVGANGQALLMKVSINLSLPIQFLGLCEGILLAEKGGIPRETALKVWINSALSSPATAHRAAFLVEKPEEAWFDVNMMQKDMLLALDLGRTLEVPLLGVALSNELLTAARAMGLAKEDFACMFEVLAKLAGLNE